MSPEASPAERRSGIGGMWDGAEISRWRGARRFRPSGWSRRERAVPAPCIATGTGDSRFRAEREAPDARLARAAFGKGADEFAEADFVNGAFDGGAIDAGRAQSNVRFNGAGKKKGILEHDAELAAEILQVDQANVFAVEKNLSALNVVKAEQEGDERGFPGAGMTDDGEGLAGGDAERDIAQNPVVVGGLGDIVH